MSLSHIQGYPRVKNDPSDIESAERYNQFSLGWFANPIFGNGDYPDVMKWQIGNKSQAMHIGESRLPTFSNSEKQLLKGSADFLGLNLYTATLVTKRARPLLNASYDNDRDVEFGPDPKWPSSGSDWLKVTPFALRGALTWIKDHYNNCPVLITENGVSDNNGGLDDVHRVAYIRDYIDEVLKAIRIDGCDVKGYSVWSLLDNFEWMRGYSERFGLHFVNFSDPERQRIPKLSANYYRSIIEHHGFLKDQCTETQSPTHSSKENIVQYSSTQTTMINSGNLSFRLYTSIMYLLISQILCQNLIFIF
ncbi:hypothetical protein ACJMK2_012183 [Sinanodonta woodiana]|uniref:Uncharacterized protein n=1 Tax=Sinanodonta woodiana TaxID=1069815 RepID=A0ABD3V9G8_SINWO